MLGDMVTIIIDQVFNKSVPKPVNVPDMIWNMFLTIILKLITIEKQYDDLSVIRLHETPQQWANRIRALCKNYFLSENIVYIMCTAFSLHLGN